MASKYRGIFSLQFLLPNVALLAVVAICIETFYAHVVRPAAEDILRERDLKIQAGASPKDVETRSLYTIIFHTEPEVEVIFCTWGMLYLSYMFFQITRERQVLHRKFLQLEAGERIIPENAAEHFTEVKALVDSDRRLSERLLPKCILAALHRFNASGSIQESSTAVKETAERMGDDLDSALGLVRYIAWAIPAWGFVGTVRGIGAGLNFAEQAIKGDLSPVTRNLGLAFNSTLVGLSLCILLMYVIHMVQSTLETLISQVLSYCDENVIDVMRVPAAAEKRQAWEVAKEV
jgi:biopolymer transport protein ExbB/TolQ